MAENTRAKRFLHMAGHLAKNNVVLLVAVAAAAVTCFFVPFDAEYAGYFDWSTLACLFSTLAVVAAFKNIRFFVWLADLPLGYFVLDSCGNKKQTAFVFIMQNIAANLGGMLTPFGNPQNLYLYSYFSIPTGEFFAIMAIPFAAAFFMILGICLFVKPEPADLKGVPQKTPSVWRSVVYGLLFALSLLIVFRVFPYYWGLVAVVAALLVLDPRALVHVDYSLLLTFCAFFVFSGNLARIPAVEETLGALVEKDPLAVGVLSCQVISNVPSSVLLSKFTENYPALLIAVNAGGLGTPIASLASLITLNTYRRMMPGETGKYIVKFLIYNFAFLLVLVGVGYLTLLLF